MHKEPVAPFSQSVDLLLQLGQVLHAPTSPPSHPFLGDPTNTPERLPGRCVHIRVPLLVAHDELLRGDRSTDSRGHRLAHPAEPAKGEAARLRPMQGLGGYRRIYLIGDNVPLVSHTPVAQSQACRSVRSCHPVSFLMARQHARSNLSSVGGDLLTARLPPRPPSSVGEASLPMVVASRPPRRRQLLHVSSRLAVRDVCSYPQRRMFCLPS